MRWWSPVSRRRSRSQLGEWRSLCWSKIEGNGCFRQKEEQISGFPRQHNGKEPACQCRRCRRCGLCPWVRKIPWSRKWYPILIFLPEKFRGQSSLAGCSPWDHKESDMTERLSTPSVLLKSALCVVKIARSNMAGMEWGGEMGYSDIWFLNEEGKSLLRSAVRKASCRDWPQLDGLVPVKVQRPLS